jgi:hypothetical protein
VWINPFLVGLLIAVSLGTIQTGLLRRRRRRSDLSGGVVPGYTSVIGDPINFSDGLVTHGPRAGGWKMIRLEEASTPGRRTRIVVTIQVATCEESTTFALMQELAHRVQAKYKPDVIMVATRLDDQRDLRFLKAGDQKGWTGQASVPFTSFCGSLAT